MRYHSAEKGAKTNACGHMDKPEHVKEARCKWPHTVGSSVCETSSTGKSTETEGN